MNKDNLSLGQKISKMVNKKYGVITYSGTLAIEVALLSLNLKKNAKVLISSNICYSIVNTVIKLGFTPIFVVPENHLYLTDNDLDLVLKQESLDCIILVHQYGFLNNINCAKIKKKDIKIIEDIAQAWSLSATNYDVGVYSDIVVTSFGQTKPLSYGIGGALMFDNSLIFNNVDFYDDFSRNNKNILLSYTYPLCNDIKFDELIQKANKIVKEQRDCACYYYNFLNEFDYINCINYNNNSGFVWHRFPIWIDDFEKYLKFVEFIGKTELQYQLPHEIDLIDLVKFKEYKKIDNSKIKKNIILLRTRNIDINKQLEILNKILKQF